MLYFAYGSNMAPDFFLDRCPGAVPYGPALLSGYRIAFRYRSTSFPGGGAADIIADANSRVWGVLYEIDEGHLEALDVFEDCAANGYRRIEVEAVFESVELDAWCYEVVDKLPTDFRPVPEYLDLMVEGALQNGLPETYIDEITSRVIEASPTCPA